MAEGGKQKSAARAKGPAPSQPMAKPALATRHDRIGMQRSRNMGYGTLRRACKAGCGCAECRKGAEDGATRVHAKLKIGAADAPEERIADARADSVLHAMRAGDARGAATDPAMLHRSSPESGGVTAVPSEVEAQLANMQSGGEPLPAPVKSRMEPAFGADFGSVRIHRDAQAASSAEAIGANAFAVGNHIAFNHGTFVPGTHAGDHLIAHELSHVVDADAADAVRRNGDNRVCTPLDPSELVCEVPAEPEQGPEPDAPDTPSAAEMPENAEPGEVSVEIEGRAYSGDTFRVLLSDSRTHVRAQLISLSRAHGQGVMVTLAALLHNRQMGTGHGSPFRLPDPTPIETYRTIYRLVEDERKSLKREFDDYLGGFARELRRLTLVVLDANEERTRAEMVRYGINPSGREISPALPALPGGPGAAAVYGATMQTGTAAARGLARAAKMLLDRRENIDELTENIDQNTSITPNCSMMYCDIRGAFPPPELPGWIKERQKATKAYERLLPALAHEYPPLAHFGRLDVSIDGLRDVASEREGGNRAADALSDRMTEQLGNIAEVREEMDDGLNYWRLDNIVGLAMAERGMAEDSLEASLVREKVEIEQPGWLQAVALAVLDIGALLLAPATGGLSLVVAAGVNIAVAVDSVQTYMLQDALANTSFDPARALSSREPEFLWVAIDVISVIPAVGEAAAVFRPLTRGIRALRAANTAGDIAEIGRAETLIRRIAQEAGLSQTAIARMIASGDDLAGLAHLGATADEIAELRRARTIADDALDTAGAAARADGTVHASRNGTLFSCTSPCTAFREKYAGQLANSPSLERELSELERAAAAAGGNQTTLDDIARQGLELESRIRGVELKTWTSPAAGRPNYDDLVARRGSVGPTLDRKPANWSGPEEAMFRYGVESEPGYRWILRETGEIDYRRAPGFRQSPDHPPRRYNPLTRQYEDVAPVVMEDLATMTRLASAGRAATTIEGWLNTLRAAVPKLADLDNAALHRILSKSPNLHHMRGQIVEELGGVELAARAADMGEDVIFIPGHELADSLGRQISDGMILRRAGGPEDVFEVVMIGEAKAGRMSAQGLVSHRSVSFDRLSQTGQEWINLEGEAIEAWRQMRGLRDGQPLPAWARSSEALTNHGDEIETLMRTIHAENMTEMGQVGRDIERLVPNVDAPSVPITRRRMVDGEMIEETIQVRARPSETEVLAISRTDVELEEVVRNVPDRLRGNVSTHQVDLLESELLEIARLLRAEQTVNGRRLRDAASVAAP